MREYQGKMKSVQGLGIAVAVLIAIILIVLLTMGFGIISGTLIIILSYIIVLLYRGMVLRITVDQEKVSIYRPFLKKDIKFSNIAFCMVHGIDETNSIVYAFVKKRFGVKGVKQKLSFEEIVRIINKSNENIDLDINFNMSEKIPVSFVENSEALKADIINTLGGHQKKILNNI